MAPRTTTDGGKLEFARGVLERRASSYEEPSEAREKALQPTRQLKLKLKSTAEHAYRRRCSSTHQKKVKEVNEAKRLRKERKLDPCGVEAKSEASSMDSGSVCLYRAVLPGDVT